MRMFKASVNPKTEAKVLDTLCNRQLTRLQMAKSLVEIDAVTAVSIIAKLFRVTIFCYLEEIIETAKSLEVREENSLSVRRINTSIIGRFLECIKEFLGEGISDTPEHLHISESVYDICTEQQTDAIEACRRLFRAINDPDTSNIELLLEATFDTIFKQR